MPPQVPFRRPSYFTTKRFPKKFWPGSWHYHGGLALHVIRLSLAGVDWPGKCDLYCGAVPPALPYRTVCPIRSCSAAGWWHFQLLLYSKCSQTSTMTHDHGRRKAGRDQLFMLTAPWFQQMRPKASVMALIGILPSIAGGRGGGDRFILWWKLGRAARTACPHRGC
jgi:hypothetical protein